MSKILKETIEAVYPTIRDVHKRLTPRPEGIRTIRDD